ncbi:MAG TPA: TetR/AcrR family transcriptional regulator [Rugosimonospora sp.]|nr:TetR/AcrR family transcriptional regulator [Rugosimonospora sp.]
MAVTAPAGAMPGRILDAAVALFAEQGFDATSVQQIVARAAVTKGAMYHYYRSKDDLLYAIYGTLIGEQLAGLARILDQRLPLPDTLRAVIADLVRTTATHLPAAAVFGREMHKLAGERSAELRAQRRRYHEAFRDLVARGQREGVFGTAASAETVTLMVFGIVNQLPLWYRPDGPTSPGDLAAEISAFVLAGLSAR